MLLLRIYNGRRDYLSMRIKEISMLSTILVIILILILIGALPRWGTAAIGAMAPPAAWGLYLLFLLFSFSWVEFKDAAIAVPVLVTVKVFCNHIAG